MILILTRKDDDHTAIVIKALEARGAPYVRLNTSDFPQQVSLAVLMKGDGCEASLHLGGRSIDLKEVTAVWYRRPGMPIVSEALQAEDQSFAFQESVHFLRGMWRLLRDKFWVNSFDNTQEGEYKPYQLRVAQKVGFTIPRTLLGNSPAEAERFIRSTPGDAVYKCYNQYIRTEGEQPKGIYTNRVRGEDLSRMASIQLAPCIFQEYIEKKVELRVTVIGRKIFAAEIHSQQSARSRDDWRRYDLPNTPYRPHRLPPEVEDKCHALLREMGLVFGCIDLILTPGGEYVFLEINPNGQWYWVELLAGLPMLSNFTEMLIQGTPDYAEPPTVPQPLGAAPRARRETTYENRV